MLPSWASSRPFLDDSIPLKTPIFFTFNVSLTFKYRKGYLAKQSQLLLTFCQWKDLYTVTQSLTSDNLQAALSHIFIPRQDNGVSTYQGHHNMFLWDYYIFMTSGVLWCFITARNRERAKIIKAQWSMLTAAFVVGIITIGLAAFISAFCLWWASKIA